MSKEEVKVETEETKVETTEKEIPQETLDANKKFDSLINDDDNSAIEDTDEEKDAEEEAAKEESGEEEAVEQTAKDKEIEAETKAIEEQILADDDAKAAKAKETADAKAAAEAKEAGTEDEPYDCGLDPEEYDEEIIKKLNEQGQARLDAEKVNAELRGQIASQSTEMYTNWLDKRFSELGEDFHEVLGEGEFEDLEPASEQMENRMKIDSRMALTAKAYRKLGKTVPSRSKLFKQAVLYLHKDIVNKSKTEADTIEKLSKRAGQAIGKGTGKGSAKSAEEKAAKVISDFDKKLDED